MSLGKSGNVTGCGSQKMSIGMFGNVTGSKISLLGSQKVSLEKFGNISLVQEHTSIYRVCVTSCFYIKL